MVKVLGSRILFRIPIEIGFLFAKHHGVSIMFAHVSNAYLAEPNEGLDRIGIGTPSDFDNQASGSRISYSRLKLDMGASFETTNDSSARFCASINAAIVLNVAVAALSL